MPRVDATAHDKVARWRSVSAWRRLRQPVRSVSCRSDAPLAFAHSVPGHCDRELGLATVVVHHCSPCREQLCPISGACDRRLPLRSVGRDEAILGARKNRVLSPPFPEWEGGRGVRFAHPRSLTWLRRTRRLVRLSLRLWMTELAIALNDTLLIGWLRWWRVFGMRRRRKWHRLSVTRHGRLVVVRWSGIDRALLIGSALLHRPVSGL